MELLTGKAKEDFLEYYWENKINNIPMTICRKNDLEEFFNSIHELFQHSLIIEWLDSVRIYIEIKNKFGQNKQRQRFSFVVKKYNSGFMFDTRLEATIEAIKIANNFYNGR